MFHSGPLHGLFRTSAIPGTAGPSKSAVRLLASIGTAPTAIVAAPAPGRMRRNPCHFAGIILIELGFQPNLPGRVWTPSTRSARGKRMASSKQPLEVLLLNPGGRAAVYQELGDRYSEIEPPSLRGCGRRHLHCHQDAAPGLADYVDRHPAVTPWFSSLPTHKCSPNSPAGSAQLCVSRGESRSVTSNSTAW